MEQGREQLDLVAPDAELELAAAVGPDAVRGAVVVGGEEALDGAEPGRLHVDRPRRPAERLDVRDGVDDGVPGDAVAVRLEHGLASRASERGPRARPRGARRRPGGRAPASGTVSTLVPWYWPLKSTESTAPVSRSSAISSSRPVGGRVELEAEAGVEVEPRPQARRSWRARRAASRRRSQRLAACGRRPSPSEMPGLAQRQIERGALERPSGGSRDRRAAPARGRRAAACARCSRERLAASSPGERENGARAPGGGRARRRRR